MPTDTQFDDALQTISQDVSRLKQHFSNSSTVFTRQEATIAQLRQENASLKGRLKEGKRARDSILQKNVTLIQENYGLDKRNRALAETNQALMAKFGTVKRDLAALTNESEAIFARLSTSSDAPPEAEPFGLADGIEEDDDPEMHEQASNSSPSSAAIPGRGKPETLVPLAPDFGAAGRHRMRGSRRSHAVTIKSRESNATTAAAKQALVVKAQPREPSLPNCPTTHWRKRVERRAAKEAKLAGGTSPIPPPSHRSGTGDTPS